MAEFGKVLQLITAGGGFLAGYLWGVHQWARGADAASVSLVQASLPAGIGLAVLYAGLLGGLFWACLPTPKTRGLRVVISPAAFTLSFFAGALGIQGALWMLGG